MKDNMASSSSDWEPWSALMRKRSNHILVKLLISALLMGLSFRLLFSRSSTAAVFSPVLTDKAAAAAPTGVGGGELQMEPPAMVKSGDPDTVIPAKELDVDEQESQNEKCDLFIGEWIRNPSGPSYTNTSCRFIEDPQNCIRNGRPDTGYLYWQWKPKGCDVPRFDAKKFLETMRDKTWALIGDSILRNHVQSLLCLLSKEELAVEVYHDEDYKSRRWRFPAHNFTISLVWAPFLIKAEIFENDDGESSSAIQLHLDQLDSKWTTEYLSYDYVVISAGQWFLKTAIYWENSTVVGCHYCHGKNLTELGVEYAYRKALGLLFRFVTSCDHKPLVLYRTWTPDHFENGEWFSGGICNRTVPFRKGEYNGKDVDHLMHNIELEEFEKTTGNGSEVGAWLKLLDTYLLSLLRPDGHSGPYRNFHPFSKDRHGAVQNDCLHWCLPGPIDSWNDLVMKMVLDD